MQKRPNIIFIMSDDQGAWAMHCAGTPELYTPNLDRIAASGMRFENFFCVSPVCSPARASLLTGKIPSAHGIHDWLRSGNVDAERFAAQGRENPYGGYRDERKPIRYLEGQTTYTQLLAEAGYTCGLSGKWHLGDSVCPQCGFSKWYTMGKGGAYYYHGDMVENGDIRVEHGKYVTELITDKALAYLEEMQGGRKSARWTAGVAAGGSAGGPACRERPYYLSIHYTAPHSPWGAEQHPQKWIDYYKDCDFASIPDVPDHPDLTTGPVYGTPARRENLVGYFAAVSAMDEQIGRILDRLEELSLLEDTLVIFTSDNGMSMGHHGIWGKGNGTFPMNMFDTAVKVPFLASWKGHIPAGSLCSELVSAYDVFPTVLELAGIKQEAGDLPEKLSRFPGKSFAGLLLNREGLPGQQEPAPVRENLPGREPASARDDFSGQQELSAPSYDRGENAIMVLDEYGPVRMIRTKEWKYVHRYPEGKNELYHLTTDPGENVNLYGQPQFEGKALELLRKLEGWFETYADPRFDGRKEKVTGDGQTEEACGKGLPPLRM